MTQNNDRISSYVDAISVPTPHIWPLAERLENVAPIDIDATEKSALDRLKGIAQEVLEVLTERERSVMLVAPAFRALQKAWSAVNGALTAYAVVPEDLGDRGARAGMLQRELFPKGIGWVTSDAPQLYAEGVRRVQRLDAENLREPLVLVIGTELVAAAERATKALGDAIGVGSTRRESPSTTALREKRRRFLRAVAKYGRLLAAKMDEDDPASVERFRRASAPMDEYRMRRTTAEDDVEIAETPAPVVPATPVTPTA